MKFLLSILILVVAGGLPVCGMDRFAALSMIESGDCDSCVGPDGEISRYQISPGACSEFGKSFDTLTNQESALRLAIHIMRVRCAEFHGLYHRSPTDFQWYLLWHRPAIYLATRQRRPTAKEVDRAQRFSNLVNR